MKKYKAGSSRQYMSWAGAYARPHGPSVRLVAKSSYEVASHGPNVAKVHLPANYRAEKLPDWQVAM
jgi:hypothetical protein